jgi:NADP-dependent 3-hydroxy acid dehydrogenase YdfG
MPTIAIVGAGPGLGHSIAKVFGGHRFNVALISRNTTKLDALVRQLAQTGITAVAFPADVMDRPSLTTALEQAAAQFGAVDVLEYSPYSGLIPVYPLEATVDNIQFQIEHHLYGAVTAAQAVLPAMLEAGSGTLLFTTGGGAITPFPMLSTMNIAQAGLRNWVLNLNGVLADKGIYAGNVAINVFIGANAPEGVPHADPNDIAQSYWNLHTHRDKPEHIVTA